MNKSIFMVVKVITIIIMLAAVAMQAMIMFTSKDLNNCGALEGYFKLAYASLGITAILAVLFFITAIFGYTKKQIIMLVASFALLGVVYLISNSLADGGNLSAKFLADNPIDFETSKFVGASLIFSYIMFAITVFAVLASTVVGVFK